MEASFAEIARVLKPDAWATVVFDSSDSEVWAVLRTSVERAGFDLANATYLDKQQQSHKGYKGRSGVEDVAAFDVVLNLHKPGQQRRRPKPPGGVDAGNRTARPPGRTTSRRSPSSDADRRRTLPFLHSLLVQAHFNGSLGLEVGHYALVRRICRSAVRVRLRRAFGTWPSSTRPGDVDARLTSCRRLRSRTSTARSFDGPRRPCRASSMDVSNVPFLLKPTGLLPLAVFAFTVTDPPGGREATELKIQLIAPGQGRHERGNSTHRTTKPMSSCSDTPSTTTCSCCGTPTSTETSLGRRTARYGCPRSQTRISPESETARGNSRRAPRAIVTARPDHLATRSRGVTSGVSTSTAATFKTSRSTGDTQRAVTIWRAISSCPASRRSFLRSCRRLLQQHVLRDHRRAAGSLR